MKVKVKVTNLTKIALEWLIHGIEGRTPVLYKDALLAGELKEGTWVSGLYRSPNVWIPLSEWNQHQLGLIGWHRLVERECIGVRKVEKCVWSAQPFTDNGLEESIIYGPTPQIAVYRCFIAMRLGEEVTVQDEFMDFDYVLETYKVET